MGDAQGQPSVWGLMLLLLLLLLLLDWPAASDRSSWCVATAAAVIRCAARIARTTRMASKPVGLLPYLVAGQCPVS